MQVKDSRFYLQHRGSMRHSESNALPAHSLKVCRGAVHCPHAVSGQNIGAELEAVVEDSGWSRFLADRTNPIRHHHQFRLAVSSCPNGCSQPHITDFGLISAVRIGLAPDSCSGCGQCVMVCAEKALHLEDGMIRLDPSRCLGCAACVRVCPAGALRAEQTAYRVVLGGKLGRHPRLAHELGFHTLPEALGIVDRVLRVLMENHRPGLRLGTLIEEMGRETFNAKVRA